MTIAHQLKRIYMVLRWYDSHVAYSSIGKHSVTDEDFKLVMQLQKEYSELQAEALRVKKEKKARKQQKTKSKPRKK
jgi:hypothetical protein